MTGSVVSTVLTVGAPLVVRQVIDMAVRVQHADIDVWLLLLTGIGVARFCASYVRRWHAGRLAFLVERDLRVALHRAIQRLDGSRLDKLRTGQVMSRVISDVTLVQNVLQMVPLIIQSVLTLAIATTIMLVLSPVLALLVVAMTAVLYLVATRFPKVLFAVQVNVQQRTANLTEMVDANLTGAQVVKGFGQEQAELDRFTGLARLLFVARMHLVQVNAKFSSAFMQVPVFAQAGVLVLGGLLTIRGNFSLGTLVAFITYMGMMVIPVRMLSLPLGQAQEARACLIRMFELLDITPELQDGSRPANFSHRAPSIEFDDVHFGHDGAPRVLDGFSLRIEPGETVALVGRSGSGKSTAAMLVPRFHDVSGGSLRLGGTDVRELTLSSLRSHVGVVFDETFLFSTSVRENIALGRPDATDAEVMAAAQAAQANDFILALPDGYGTVLGDRGLTLSGGQRQRIALARALLTDPRILVLDDATSAVDPNIEADIHAALRDFVSERTVLLVAHRRSTLRLATRIAVLDGGRITDIGTHEELMSRCALYRQLVIGAEPGLDTSPQPAGPAPDTTHHRTSGTSSRVRPVPPKPAPLPHVDDLVSIGKEQGDLRLHRLWKPFRAGLLAGLVLMAADTISQLLFPALVRSGVDEGVAHGDSTVLVAAGLWQLAIGLTAWLVIYGEIWITGRTSERMLHVLRVKLFAHLQRLGLDFHERESNGAILTRMTTDFTTLAEFLRTGLGLAVVSMLTCLGVLVALFTVDVSLALVVLALIPVVIAASVLYARMASTAYNSARGHLDKVNLGFQDALWGARVAHAFGLLSRNAERFRALADGQLLAQMRFQRYFAVFFSLIEFISDFTIALVVTVGAAAVAAGSLTTGDLVAFCLYAGMLFIPVLQASQLLDQYQRARAGLDRILDLMHATPAISEPRTAAPVGRLRGEIVLDAVHYRYPNSEREALAGISTRISSGQTVAIVGESGSGKTTLMKLIARMYEPTAGAVRVDGRDLRQLPGPGYRQRLGLIPQEPCLLGRTIRDAIAFGWPEASDDEVRAAAEVVKAHRMIMSLPGGYEYELAESGTNLSFGQRQLIALARAYLVDPDILLLDEATAALDLSTEAAVGDGIANVNRGRTTLVIAHRLSTARQADRILVLERGRIVEDGSHHELLALQGVYANLWKSYASERHGGH